MPLNKDLSKKINFAIWPAAVAAVAVLVFNYAFADSGPVMMNANPQGLVTNSNVKLTMDTQDLARCRYSTEDEDFDSMSDNMTSPDGLYHYASLGTMNKGSYTYYARCKDFMEQANEESTQFKFNVGDFTYSTKCTSNSDCSVTGQVCQNGSCVTQSAGGGDTAAPTVSSPMPTGTLYDSYITLSVTTSEPASCRYSWYDKTYDAMTLSFASDNRYYHTAPITLSQYGYYVVYVRCKDDAGNPNLSSAKIGFRYASRTPIDTGGGGGGGTTVPKDTAAPVISSLFPTGDIKDATTTISCITDEKATCKYDTTDASFDSMANTFDADSTGKSFSKSINLNKAGSYTFYVRCKDALGNKSSASSQIGFNYVIPVVEGPKISNLQPAGGTIYQKNVALILQTDKPSDCRYSTDDVDYDEMEEKFSTSDGLLQQATMTLDKFGQYTFYVRCADKQGNKDDSSEIASFTYKDANAGGDGGEDLSIKCEKDGDCKDGKTCQDGTCQKAKEETKPVECKEITSSKKDGACDKISDCICDPDCPASGDDVDPDCANVKPAQDNSWVVLLLIGIVLVVVIVIIIVIIKKRGSDEEDVELP